MRNFADDRGAFEWSPLKLKMLCLPADNCDVLPLLAELEASGQVLRYEKDGRSYGLIRNFMRLQRPQKPKYLYPVPPEFGADTGISETEPEPVRDQSGNGIIWGASIPRIPPHKKKKKVSKEVSKEDYGVLRTPCPIDHENGFESWYAEFPNKVGRRAAEKSYRAALRRANPADLLEGLRRYVASKPPDRAWCGPAVWLNQDRWLDEPAEIGVGVGNGNHRQGPVDKLREGAARAAAAIILRERSGLDRGDDLPSLGPLLDHR